MIPRDLVHGTAHHHTTRRDSPLTTLLERRHDLGGMHACTACAAQVTYSARMHDGVACTTASGMHDGLRLLAAAMHARGLVACATALHARWRCMHGAVACTKASGMRDGSCDGSRHVSGATHYCLLFFSSMSFWRPLSRPSPVLAEQPSTCTHLVGFGQGHVRVRVRSGPGGIRPSWLEQPTRAGSQVAVRVGVREQPTKAGSRVAVSTLGMMAPCWREGEGCGQS